MKKKFSFDTISDFDKHINKSIPGYSDMNNMIRNLSNYFIEKHTNVYDIGCSTGEFIKKLRVDKDKSTNFIGLEISKNFTKNFKNESNLFLMDKDLTKFKDFNNASFITSIFTLQFISQRYRQDIINRIYKGLNKGGAFILSEKVLAKNTKIENMFTFLYYDFKKNEFSSNEILDKEEDLRSLMKPITLEENIEMLKKAGFKDFEVIWRNFNFLSIIAIK